MNWRLLMACCLILVACARTGDDGARGGRVVLQNKGSDTLVNVAQAWAEAYKDINPKLAVAVTGGGSGTGIAALINGTVDLANASRRMRDREIEAARANGVEPIEFVVGYDALAVFVHPDNPIEEISLATLAEIYGEQGGFETWGNVDITVPTCSNGEIIRVSRQNNSGTYVYFKNAVLGKGDFKLGSRDMHGSKDVVDLISKTPCAIGYSGLAYATHEVKLLNVTKGEGQPAVAPSIASAIDGTYPIARPLFMYTAGEPTGPVKEYLDWILSEVGQCIITEKGYAPARPVACGGASDS